MHDEVARELKVDAEVFQYAKNQLRGMKGEELVLEERKVIYASLSAVQLIRLQQISNRILIYNVGFEKAFTKGPLRELRLYPEKAAKRLDERVEKMLKKGRLSKGEVFEIWMGVLFKSGAGEKLDRHLGEQFYLELEVPELKKYYD